MKNSMQGHIDSARHTVFKEATENVRKQLNQMVRTVEEDMSNRTDEVFVAMRRDYRSILGGGEVPQGEVMPKWAKDMRKEVMRLIDGVEERFTKIANAEEEPPKPDEEDAMDLEKDDAAEEGLEGTTAVSDPTSAKSETPHPDVNRSSDSTILDPDTIADPAQGVKPKPDTAETINHLKDHDKQEAIVEIDEDARMIDAQLAALAEPAVADSECSPSRETTPAKDETAVTENSIAESVDDSAVADEGVDASTNDILDW